MGKLNHEIKLSKEEAKVLANHEKTVLDLKIKLADLQLSIFNFENEKKKVMELIQTESDQFLDSVRQFAVKYGINPDGDPNKEKWSLDTSKMTFHKDH